MEINRFVTIDRNVYRIEPCSLQKPDACVMCCGAETLCRQYNAQTGLTLCDASGCKPDDILLCAVVTPTAEDLKRQSRRLKEKLDGAS